MGALVPYLLVKGLPSRQAILQLRDSGTCWSPSRHSTYPDEFREAVVTMLLVFQRVCPNMDSDVIEDGILSFCKHLLNPTSL